MMPQLVHTMRGPNGERSIVGYHGDMPQSRYRGPPMTLANMRAQGVWFAMGRP